MRIFPKQGNILLYTMQYDLFLGIAMKNFLSYYSYWFSGINLIYWFKIYYDAEKYAFHQIFIWISIKTAKISKLKKKNIVCFSITCHVKLVSIGLCMDKA